MGGTKNKRANNTDAQEGSSKKSKGTDKKERMNEVKSDLGSIDFTSNATTTAGKKWNLKISSFNVNGIRAWLQKDGVSYVQAEDPDILCLQETKCSPTDIPPSAQLSGYHHYWSGAEQAGYAGTGLCSKIKPLSVTYGIGVDEHDHEGRCITAEYDNFYLVTSYVPNSGRGLPRLTYRQGWDTDFRKYLQGLDSKKPVILCGDLNVAHQEIDLKNPKTNKKTAGFTMEEREGFATLLKAGFVDSFRHLYPDESGAYSFWSYLGNARAKGIGWRLDYFVLSERLKANLCDSIIRKTVMGSDHCPITLLMAF